MKRIYTFFLFLVLTFLFNSVSLNHAFGASIKSGNSSANGVSVPVTNLQCTLDQLSGNVNLSWDCIPSFGFLYYSIVRNGIEIAMIPSQTLYSDLLPQNGQYTYCVSPVYGSGNVLPMCIELNWYNPILNWSPGVLSATLVSNSYTSPPLILAISNNGTGTLNFEFPEYIENPNVGEPLDYCSALATSEDEYISHVQFGTIDNSSGWFGYNDFTSLTTDVIKGISYPINVTIGPPSYSNDITGIWIDFDHSGIFDNSEFTALTGSANPTGTILIPSSALNGITTIRIRTQYAGVLSACGDTEYGEVEDYTVNIHEPSFITYIEPSSYSIPPGNTKNVSISYSAVGQYSDTGIYVNWLNLVSNDPNQPSVLIQNTMVVNLPSYIEGTVTDSFNGEPLKDVLIQADPWHSTFSDENGFYSIPISIGTYSISFSKIGYSISTLTGITITAGNTSTVNAILTEIPYPPACATATVDTNGTHCIVNWCVPTPPYELIYDDGSADFFADGSIGNMKAVKFSPLSYPARITGANLFLNGGMGSTININVCLPDADGLPGIVIDSLAVSVINQGWVTINGMNASIENGDFFIVMFQNSLQPYLGVDSSVPCENRSFTKNSLSNEPWQIASDQDFMIRAIVQSPADGDGIQSKNNDDIYTERVIQSHFSQVENNVFRYTIGRFFLGATNPVPPDSAIVTLLELCLDTTNYIDGAWNSFPSGWYTYGISTVYPNGMESERIYTNIVPCKMNAHLTLTTILECGASPAEGAIVKLYGLEYPYSEINVSLPQNGVYSNNQIIRGEYNLSVTKPGYIPYDTTISVINTIDLNVTLFQNITNPTDLFVDSLSLVATWQHQGLSALSENFESADPPGWTTQTYGFAPWHFTEVGSGPGFQVPSHSTYAITTDGAADSLNNGCCDYLIAPALDLSSDSGYVLSFNSFYTGESGQLATVEMSTDDGSTWNGIFTVQPAAYWQTLIVDLSEYSGKPGFENVKFAFHANDGGTQASGWAVDDVNISSPIAELVEFSVYLDGVEMGQTFDPTWDFASEDLLYGHQYQAGVSAIYCNTDSEIDTFSFTSYYLNPPLNFSVDTIVTLNSGEAILSWLPPATSCAVLTGYSVLKNGLELIQLPVDSNEYHEFNLDPGEYCYQIAALYNVTSCGYSGIHQSVFLDPECVDIVFGATLPFTDDFSSGEFDTTMWNPGINWLIDDQSDNPVPAAKFKWEPLITQYSSSLESFWLNSTSIDTIVPYNIWFNYEVKLEDQLQTGTEKLTAEVWDGNNWNTMKEYLNTGSFDWIMERVDITSWAKDRSFKVRFRANGDSSNAISYWSVDNVEIYSASTLEPPLNLVVDITSTSDNDVQLTWISPLDFESGSGFANQPIYTAELGNRITPLSETEINESVSDDLIKSINLSLTGYNIYRRAYTVFPAGSNTNAAGEWDSIAYMTEPNYLDTNLSNLETNCYEYQVKAVYNEGVSEPSNIDWECIFVGVNPNDRNEVSVYPNPATTYVRIDLTKEVSQISIYNSLGSVVADKNVKGETTITINTTNYAAGAYSVKFTTANGESFSRKFVVTK